MSDDRTEAFERLCREEYAALVRTAYLITGDREEALDVAQEALARAYERWRTVSALDRPGAWLQRVAGNLAISWRRRQRIQRAVVQPDPSSTSSPEPMDQELLSSLRALRPASGPPWC